MATDMSWGVPEPPGVTQFHPNTVPLLGLRQRRPTISLSRGQGSTRHPQPRGIQVPKELMDAPGSGTQGGKGGHISSPSMAKAAWQFWYPTG